MFVTSLFLVLTSLATQSVLAQNPTRAEISACWDSMYATNLPETLYLDPNDNTHFFNVSHAYDPALCTTRIPVVEFRLVNRVTQSVEMCPVKQFDGSGVLDLSCSTTLGSMARASRDLGQNDWSSAVSIGVRPQWYTVDTYFYVEPEAVSPAPKPSGVTAKKRRDTQHVFDCPIGHTYCWTGQGQEYACMNTSSDASACGQCPFAFGSDIADCTSIEGVDDVECRNSRCVVNACQRGFQISLDRTKCVDARKRSKPAARGLLF